MISSPLFSLSLATFDCIIRASSFVILIFGIWAVPKIADRFTKPDLATIGKVPEFSFTNQNQKTITNQSYHDKVYIVEFFFTTCPSICPIMNQNMV